MYADNQIGQLIRNDNLVQTISSMIWYNNFVQRNLIRDMIWYFFQYFFNFRGNSKHSFTHSEVLNFQSRICCLLELLKQNFWTPTSNYFKTKSWNKSWIKFTKSKCIHLKALSMYQYIDGPVSIHFQHPISNIILFPMAKSIHHITY